MEIRRPALKVAAMRDDVAKVVDGIYMKMEEGCHGVWKDAKASEDIWGGVKKSACGSEHVLMDLRAAALAA